jgi:cysteinyl-tRNA synthetase
MRVYNTLSGRKEEFQFQGGEVKIYVCGVTPYDDCHIGHAMSYIVFDVVRRYLEYLGHQVKYVQNFTDIDDKIIARANAQGISTQELSGRFIERYFVDMDDLNIQQAHVYPRATQEIPRIIEIIQALVNKGHAYPSDGSVYFRVRSKPDYGKLSHRRLDDMRPEGEEGSKEHPLDFALWKATKPGEPAWESPWGLGRPGWHIECSAMSLTYLGTTLDIHGGGQDLIFPHHENEIAQSESYSGAPFVRYWMHNGLLQLGTEKMSKSLGNLITVREALERYGADALRLFVLSSHYRSPLTYSEEVVDAASKGVERLRQAAQPVNADNREPAPDAEPYRKRFIEAMDDDFGTPQAVASLFDLARSINTWKEQGKDISQAQKTLRELTSILGLTLKEEKAEISEIQPLISLLTEVMSLIETKDRVLASDIFTPDDIRVSSWPETGADSIVELLIQARTKLRERKEWTLADRIRVGLAERGITLKDTPQGTTWKYRK